MKFKSIFLTMLVSLLAVNCGNNKADMPPDCGSEEVIKVIEDKVKEDWFGAKKPEYKNLKFKFSEIVTEKLDDKVGNYECSISKVFLEVDHKPENDESKYYKLKYKRGVGFSIHNLHDEDEKGNSFQVRIRNLRSYNRYEWETVEEKKI